MPPSQVVSSAVQVGSLASQWDSLTEFIQPFEFHENTEIDVLLL